MKSSSGSKEKEKDRKKFLKY